LLVSKLLHERFQVSGSGQARSTRLIRFAAACVVRIANRPVITLLLLLACAKGSGANSVQSRPRAANHAYGNEDTR
jgi:hypothetical protein